MIPTIKANGAEIPAIGLGTWDLRGETVVRSVLAALDAGYRHIDTAAMYANETQIGEAIRAHAVPRNEIFITTKVWPSDVADGALQRSAEASLRRLQVDRVDLLLIHWPSATIPLKEQIAALCDAKRRGFTRHIGVSNFPVRYVEAAVAFADEPLVTNQVEHHPWLDQSRLFEACRKHGLSITSYSPIGKGKRLTQPVLQELARAKGKTPAQMTLRWHIQQPMNIAIPRSSKPERIAENIAIFDFTLTPQEMAQISSLAHSKGRMLSPMVPLDWDGMPPR
jgi:diketogulonate reductase-like aldo/keto reductase